jgi:hypothetical protein
MRVIMSYLLSGNKIQDTKLFVLYYGVVTQPPPVLATIVQDPGWFLPRCQDNVTIIREVIRFPNMRVQ